MRVLRIILLGCLSAAATHTTAAWTAARQTPAPQPEGYLSWSEKQAEAVITAMIIKGRVLGTRRGVLNTEAPQKYDVRAIWLTPEVIRASTRLIQLAERLSDQETRALVNEAEAVGVLVVLVEIDPDEGSGVIPTDWDAFLQARGAPPDAAVRGSEKPRLQELRVLHNVVPRDYKYDRFWMVFPIETKAGKPIFSDTDREAELTVRIRGRETSVRWAIPDSIRQRMASLALSTPK